MTLKFPLRRAVMAGLILAGAGCATAVPVQEMSNARQAVRAAEEVDAARYAPLPMRRARVLLEQARLKLEAGDYRQARVFALDARRAAYRARQRALAGARTAAW